MYCSNSYETRPQDNCMLLLTLYPVNFMGAHASFYYYKFVVVEGANVAAARKNTPGTRPIHLPSLGKTTQVLK